MTGSMAISGNYGSDPYFQAAMQEYYKSLQQQTDNTKVATTTAPSSLTFQGGTVTETEEKGLSTAAKVAIGAGIAVLGAAAFIYSKGKSGLGFVERMKDGGKTVWNGVKGIFSGSAAKSGATGASAKPTAFTVTGDTCTIPGKVNWGNTESAAQAIGGASKSFASGSIPPGATVHAYEFIDAAGNVIKVNGKNFTVTNGSGLSITEAIKNPKNPADQALKDSIKGVMEGVAKGNTSGIKPTAYRITQNGVTSQFRLPKLPDGKPDFGKDFELTSFISKNFAKDSDAVTAYCAKNPDAAKLLKDIADGNLKDLKVANATFDSTGIGQFVIKDGQLAGIIPTTGENAGKLCPVNSDTFQALQEKNKDIFKNILGSNDGWNVTTYTL